MDNLWSRRTNSTKLSLSTSGSAAPGDGSSGRNTFAKRLGGDSSSHGKSNPYSSVSAGAGAVASPTGGGASSAFGLGSGAFASFGSAKTPKTPGNPFEISLGAGISARTPGAERSSRDGGLDRAIAKPGSSSSLSGPAATTTTTTSSTTATAGTATGGSAPTVHPLRDCWVFWFRPPISKANGFIEYEKTLHPIASCAAVEEFLAVYQHLKRPSALPLVSDYHLFRKGVRPIWEDDENKKGGKWIVRLKKGVADRYWEDLLLAVIGDQFGDAADEVCGVVLSVRNGEDILSIWARTDGGRVLKIRETMRRVLAFPPDTKIEWKSHDSSIQQRTAIEESRREKANSHHYHNDKRPSKQHHSHHHHHPQQQQQERRSDDYKSPVTA